jgi:hypothetical protein
MVRNTLIMFLCIMVDFVHATAPHWENRSMVGSVQATTPHPVPRNPVPHRTPHSAADESMILKVTGAQLVFFATYWDPGRLFGCSPSSLEVRFIADGFRFVGFSLFMAGVVAKCCCRKGGKEKHG